MRESKPAITSTKTHENSFIEVLPDGPAILYVDNKLTDLKSLKALFEDETGLLTANSGLKGLDILEREPQ